MEFILFFIKKRSHNKDKNRRNYVDDALEKLEEQNNEMVQRLNDNLKSYQVTEERIKLLEEENIHLRQILDEVRSYYYYIYRVKVICFLLIYILLYVFF